MSRYNYAIEVFWRERWEPLIGMDGIGLEYGRGWIANQREARGPRAAYRLVRSDGRVMDEAPALAELSVGMVPAAFGAAWSFIAAAAGRALEAAARDAQDPLVRAQLEVYARHVRELVERARS